MRDEDTIVLIIGIGGIALLLWLILSGNHKFILGATSPADLLGRIRRALGGNSRRGGGGGPSGSSSDDGDDTPVKVFNPPPPNRDGKKGPRIESLDDLIGGAISGRERPIKYDRPRPDYDHQKKAPKNIVEQIADIPESIIKMFEPRPSYDHQKKPKREEESILDDILGRGDSPIKIYEPPPVRRSQKKERNFLDDLISVGPSSSSSGANPLENVLENAAKGVGKTLGNIGAWWESLYKPSPLQDIAEGRPLSVPEIIERIVPKKGR